MEKLVHEEVPIAVREQIVMEDALVGSVKKLQRQSTEPKYRLYLAILSAVAALVAAPITYKLTFASTHITNAVTVRLALLSPVIFLIVAITIFGIFWIMQKWFSLWFILLMAGIVFIGSLIGDFIT